MNIHIMHLKRQMFVTVPANNHSQENLHPESRPHHALHWAAAVPLYASAITSAYERALVPTRTVVAQAQQSNPSICSTQAQARPCPLPSQQRAAGATPAAQGNAKQRQGRRPCARSFAQAAAARGKTVTKWPAQQECRRAGSGQVLNMESSGSSSCRRSTVRV